MLTHWGRVTHIFVSKLTIIGSDNGLSPGRRQAIIWTNAGISLIRTLGTNFSEILGEIHSSSFSKMHLKMSSAKWRLFGLGLNELITGCIGICHFHQNGISISVPMGRRTDTIQGQFYEWNSNSMEIQFCPDICAYKLIATHFAHDTTDVLSWHVKKL